LYADLPYLEKKLLVPFPVLSYSPCPFI